MKPLHFHFVVNGGNSKTTRILRRLRLLLSNELFLYHSGEFDIAEYLHHHNCASSICPSLKIINDGAFVFFAAKTLYLYCILIYIFLFLSFNSTQVHSWNVGCLSNAWRLEDMVAMHVGGWGFTRNFVGECIFSVESKIVCQLQFKLTPLPEMWSVFPMPGVSNIWSRFGDAHYWVGI